jgi:hypothetical protein
MAITTKTPIRTVFDTSNNAIGLAEFQTDEVVSITHGGTSGNSISSAKLALSLTDSNIRTLFSVSGSGSYDNSTGIITVTGGVTSVGGATGTVSNVQLGSSITQSGILTTANVVELTNLYFTDARVYSNVTSIGYATNANVALKANVVDLTTANVTELTNLYFTNARSRATISVGSGGTYDSNTGIITVSTGFVASTVTVFPGHSGNEDYGDLTSATADAFGIATGTVYDCMEPTGSLVSEDLVAL